MSERQWENIMEDALKDIEEDERLNGKWTISALHGHVRVKNKKIVQRVAFSGGVCYDQVTDKRIMTDRQGKAELKKFFKSFGVLGGKIRKGEVVATYHGVRILTSEFTHQPRRKIR